jgi:hypothetical protein
MKVSSSPSTVDKTVSAEVKSIGTDKPIPVSETTVVESTSNVIAPVNDDEPNATVNKPTKKLCFSFSSLKTNAFDAKAVDGKIVIQIPVDSNNDFDTEAVFTLDGKNEPFLTGTMSFDGQEIVIEGKLNGQEGDEDTADSKKLITQLSMTESQDEKTFVPTHGSDNDKGAIDNDSLLSLVNNSDSNRSIGSDDREGEMATNELQISSPNDDDDVDAKKVILIGSVERDVASPEVAVNKGKFLFCLFLCAHVPVVLFSNSPSIRSSTFIRTENDTVLEQAIADTSSHGEAETNDSEDTAAFTIEAKVGVSNDNTDEGMVEKDDNPSPTKKVKVDDETNVEEKDGST